MSSLQVFPTIPKIPMLVDIGQYILSYSILGFIVLAIVFIFLVNRNILLKKDTKLRRIITHPLFYYSMKRLTSAFVSIILALAITFCLFRLQNLELIYCPDNPHITPDEWRNFCDIRLEKLGLAGKPIVQQFLEYLYNVLPVPKTVCVSVRDLVSLPPGQDPCAMWQTVTTYFGASIKIRVDYPVTDLVFPLLPNSFQWGILATIIEVCIGYPLGIFMAKYQDRLVDKIGKGYIIMIDAIPGLLYYYLFMIMFQVINANTGNLFPTMFESGNIQTMLAPALTAAFAGTAGIAYWVRRYMLNEFNSDYVRFARAKGLSENKIMFTHVLRNAIVPLSRSLSTAFITCLYGSYFIESLYSIPGFGGMLKEALDKQDFMVVQCVVAVTAILSVVSYLIADIVMAIADPRISYSSKK